MLAKISGRMIGNLRSSIILLGCIKVTKPYYFFVRAARVKLNCHFFLPGGAQDGLSIILLHVYFYVHIIL